MTSVSDNLLERVAAAIEAEIRQQSNGDWPIRMAGDELDLVDCYLDLSRIARVAIEASNDLVGEMERQREQLRVLLLEQPTTDERDTYSDGFANGLAHAINCIDGAIRDARNGGGGQ